MIGRGEVAQRPPRRIGVGRRDVTSGRRPGRDVTSGRRRRRRPQGARRRRRRVQQVRDDARRPYHVVSRSLPAPRRGRVRQTGSRLRPGRAAVRCRRDDVAPAGLPTRAVVLDHQLAKLAGNASRGGGGDEHAQFVAPLVGRVHREEAQHEQVHRGRDDGEADKYEEDAEDDVAGPRLQRAVRLQRHHVAEPDRRQRHHAVVDRVEIVPALAAREHPRAAGDRQRRDAERDDDEVGRADALVVVGSELGGRAEAAAQRADEARQEERRDGVEALADRLEHDQVERDAGQRVEHAEHLAAGRLRSAVTVSWTRRRKRVRQRSPVVAVRRSAAKNNTSSK